MWEVHGRYDREEEAARLTMTRSSCIGEGEPQLLPVDNIVICAGQDPLRELYDGLVEAGQNVHLIGGADVAAELDAKRAINQGSRLAAEL